MTTSEKSLIRLARRIIDTHKPQGNTRHTYLVKEFITGLDLLRKKNPAAGERVDKIYQTMIARNTIEQMHRRKKTKTKKKSIMQRYKFKVSD